MDFDEIVDRLRNPQKYNKVVAPSQVPQQEEPASAPVVSKSVFQLVGLCISAGVILLVLITLFIMIHAKKRAENITHVGQLTADTEFNPNKNVTYVRVDEGLDRSVTVEELGTTLPIITRYNYQAITPKNYEIIGMAPWALTENFSTNRNDPQLIAYLLNRPEVVKGFINRQDVAPLLQDPQLLAALAQDNQALSDFFNKDPFAQIINNAEMLRYISNSRFMNTLLNSQSAKYYRGHPQEATALINSSPVLTALKRNPNVRQAVQENRYLKSIAKELLSLPAPTTALHPSAAGRKPKK